MDQPIELSIVMPCLNEAESLAACIRKAAAFLAQHHVQGEIIVADNGSTDGSQQLASQLGAQVVHVAQPGYGSALSGGIAAAHGRYIIMGDSDDSYDFSSLLPFLEKLREGFDLVVGNRFAGGIAPGAMPRLNRFLGNPALTSIGRLFFHSPIHDFHCGLRGFAKSAFDRMALQTSGMEFASEMIVKATLLNLRTTEVPTTLSPAGRSRPPHLRPWRDGWRHLRFMLLFSPRWLFLYPGAALILAGLGIGALLLPGPRQIGSVTFDVHTLLYAALTVLLGFQAVLFAVFTKVFAVTEGLLPPDPKFEGWIRGASLEKGLASGSLLCIIGAIGTANAVAGWSSVSFGPLEPSLTLRTIIPSILSLALGSQIILASFFLSVLQLNRRSRSPA